MKNPRYYICTSHGATKVLQMNLEGYNYFTNDYQSYEFFSEDPKGRIRKLVVFTKIPETEPPIYNLAFGDAHPMTGKLDDAVISNNEVIG